MKANFFKDQAKTASRDGTTCSNIGKTPAAINAIRTTNQCNSVLLRLPAELWINIWKIACGSTTTTLVHGMVCRDISENRLLSLLHACSLLHQVLYPIFLSQEAFVVKISSSDSSVAASELTFWLNQLRLPLFSMDRSRFRFSWSSRQDVCSVPKLESWQLKCKSSVPHRRLSSR